MSPVLPLAASLVARWTAADYLQNSESGYTGLMGWYNETSGLWDTCGWWNGANAMTAIGDVALQSSTVKGQVPSVFSNTYSVSPAYNPQPLEPGNHDSADPIAWCDHCYDDNGWWTLAWINAYDITQNGDYLALAKGIFDQNIATSYPSNCTINGVTGGSYWCDNNPYVNAIANELFLSTAAHLANRVDDADKAHYVSLAQDQWNWFKVSGLINWQNLINDGLEANCTNTGLRDIWSYNQGVILGGLVELNKAAPDSSLIDWANTLASASIGYLCDDNHIVHDKCEPNCAPDATQFKGIYIRNLVMLDQASPSDLYKTVLTANAASIWNNDRLTNNNTFGVNWAELVEGTVVRNGIVPGYTDASTSGSALDGLVGGILAA